MKRLFSTLAASAMAVSVMTAVSASALNVIEENALSVSTATVSSATSVNGTEIPAGAVAITVNISNNTGFSSSMTKLNVGTAEIITDEEGSPIVECGSAIGDSLISTAENNGMVAFSTASGNENTINGEMFTFYVLDYDCASVISNEIIGSSESNVNNTSIMFASSTIYTVGDIDGNSTVDALDSSEILSVLKKYNRDELTYSMVSLVPSVYFPNAISFKAAFIWNMGDDFDTSADITPINEGTADEILDYYTCSQVGKSYIGGSYLGLPAID